MPDPGALHLYRLIRGRPRLGIVRAPAVNGSLTFSDLKKPLKTTEGNLSVHARKLEEARYITCAQHFQGRRPPSPERMLRPHGGP